MQDREGSYRNLWWQWEILYTSIESFEVTEESMKDHFRSGYFEMNYEISETERVKIET